ncbi:putative phage abortive infection protein [Methylobacter sp. G7]|uniref:putative phage abortive infection protein n=1 Tax=Methylobacter sp. G7 TaxID=3230117 RepID=UPI003D807D2F
MKSTLLKCNTYRKQSWWKRYCVEAITVFCGLVFINLIFIAKVYRETDTINPQTAGLLGDFVGGYIGTIFALVSVVLLYANLKNQREASEQQNFETKYFELIKMHRDNVAELEVGGSSGRKIFVLLIREFRIILDVISRIAKEYKQELTLPQQLHISYYVLFFGVGPNSSRMLKSSLAAFNCVFVNALEKEFNKQELKEHLKKERKLGYLPFEGHQSRLGHYYRHLYQTVCYVDKQTIHLDKYDFVKTIRAQLTTHEQALLLINSRTPMGRDWWDKKLMTSYGMVQNIPQDFFERDNELNIDELFNENYFEWQEVA